MADGLMGEGVAEIMPHTGSAWNRSGPDRPIQLTAAAPGADRQPPGTGRPIQLGATAPPSSWASSAAHPSVWSGSATHPVPAWVAPSETPKIAASTGIEVPVHRNQSGLYEVRVTINGMGSFMFEIDSGATSVTIPVSGFMQMVKAGMIQRADYQGKAVSTLADGSNVISLVFHLASMSVGGRTVSDVRCLVVKDGGSYLLGQSFLQKFRSWSIDNARSVLVLDS
jgi:clan AA aspartic protease (TIGR02281 family)